MAKLVVKVKDVKGENARMIVEDATYNETNLKANLGTLTRCGIVGVDVITAQTLTATAPTAGGTLADNDVGAKVIIVAKDTDGNIKKYSIPAPIIGGATGILLKRGEKKRFVPAVADPTDTGFDGNTLVDMIENSYGLANGSLTFLSGYFQSKG